MEEMVYSDDESETFPENVSDYEFISDDRVCAICDDGGRLLCCDGMCKRALHATARDGRDSNCRSRGLTNAELQAHEMLMTLLVRIASFTCGELGSSDDSLSPEAFSCVNGDCGHFYHPDCVAKLFQPRNSVAEEELKQRIAVVGQNLQVYKC